MYVLQIQAENDLSVVLMKTSFRETETVRPVDEFFPKTTEDDDYSGFKINLLGISTRIILFVETLHGYDGQFFIVGFGKMNETTICIFSKKCLFKN